MKAILSLVAMLSLTACGTAKTDNSQASGFPGFNQERPLLDSVLVFSRDARPVDGALKVVTLTRTEAGKYDVTIRTAIVNRMTGESSDTTEDYAHGMTCIDSFGNYSCSVDHRPVDGALVVLSFEQGTFGYDVTATSTFIDRMQGKEIVTTEVIASSLEKQ